MWVCAPPINGVAAERELAEVSASAVATAFYRYAPGRRENQERQALDPAFLGTGKAVPDPGEAEHKGNVDRGLVEFEGDFAVDAAVNETAAAASERRGEGGADRATGRLAARLREHGSGI